MAVTGWGLGQKKNTDPGSKLFPGPPWWKLFVLHILGFICLSRGGPRVQLFLFDFSKHKSRSSQGPVSESGGVTGEVSFYYFRISIRL
jgi:hypothetical protein